MDVGARPVARAQTTADGRAGADNAIARAIVSGRGPIGAASSETTMMASRIRCRCRPGEARRIHSEESRDGHRQGQECRHGRKHIRMTVDFRRELKMGRVDVAIHSLKPPRQAGSATLEKTSASRSKSRWLSTSSPNSHRSWTVSAAWVSCVVGAVCRAGEAPELPQEGRNARIDEIEVQPEEAVTVRSKAGSVVSTGSSGLPPARKRQGQTKPRMVSVEIRCMARLDPVGGIMAWAPYSCAG
jgi:hypothetical protein